MILSRNDLPAAKTTSHSCADSAEGIPLGESMMLISSKLLDRIHLRKASHQKDTKIVLW
ncbi:MAG: hypothetical protein WD059_13445 [Balneolaceae bacterium]